MKQKLLMLSVMVVCFTVATPAFSISKISSCLGAGIGAGVAHIHTLATIWIDPGLSIATALDIAETKKQNKVTIDASEAIKKLQEALKPAGSGSCGGGGSSGDTSMATVYTAENILYTIEVSEKKSPQAMFDAVRQEVKEYLFETTDPEINGEECSGVSDKDCAIKRQNEWLLASVTLASATADKVLDQTAKKNVKDERTDAEKSEEERGTSGTNAGTGSTVLTGHFSKLASSFNSQNTPTGLYNAMADIVLDTHRQINDANALMGRNLEAQGLRVVNETGPVLLTDESEEGEE